jgi:hypothetical protein
MNLHDKIKAAKLNRVGRVTLSYSAGADVVHAWDDYQSEVMSDAGIADAVAELITEPSFKNDILEDMRDLGALDEYPRDGSGFSNYVAQEIENNFWEYDWIEQNTERYDYKRGYHTITANIETTIGNILDAPGFLFTGWKAHIKNDTGTLVVE